MRRVAGVLADLSGLTKIPLFFCNDTATTEIYTLSLHDALPILFLFLPPFQRDVVDQDNALLRSVETESDLADPAVCDAGKGLQWRGVALQHRLAVFVIAAEAQPVPLHNVHPERLVQRADLAQAQMRSVAVGGL